MKKQSNPAPPSEKPDPPPAPPKIPKQYRKAADMSLRDHFAIEIMKSMIVGNNADIAMISPGAAVDAYRLADYMIEESKK